MKWRSRLLLAALVHPGMLFGWRWQMPPVPYFFDTTMNRGPLE
jgi:hypothetical protein